MPEVSDTLYLEIVIEDMQDTFVRQLAGIGKVKDGVRSYLGAASLLISLVGALQILTVRVSLEWFGWYQVGLGAAGALYVILISLCAIALFPVGVKGPIAPDWDELTTSYQGLSKEDALLKRLSSILNAIDANRPVVKKMSRLGIAIGTLLPFLVIIFMLLAMIPRS